jgi:transcriptional regulator with XRE-family HTH domain
MNKSTAIEPEQAFGLVLRQLRVQKGLSQESLGFESELQRNFISLIELGQSAPTIKTIYKLAAALGVRPSELLTHMESLTH